MKKPLPAPTEGRSGRGRNQQQQNTSAANETGHGRKRVGRRLRAGHEHRGGEFTSQPMWRLGGPGSGEPLGDHGSEPGHVAMRTRLVQPLLDTVTRARRVPHNDQTAREI